MALSEAPSSAAAIGPTSSRTHVAIASAVEQRSTAAGSTAIRAPSFNVMADILTASSTPHPFWPMTGGMISTVAMSGRRNWHADGAAGAGGSARSGGMAGRSGGGGAGGGGGKPGGGGRGGGAGGAPAGGGPRA